MIAFAQQDESTFCFLACLESFFAENGELMKQREILRRASDVFGKNQNDLGAFSAENFKRIEGEFGLEVSNFVLGGAVKPNTPKESVFVVCAWEGRQDKIHWVRLTSATQDFIHVMDPGCDHCPRRIETPKFLSWPKALFLVRKK